MPAEAVLAAKPTLVSGDVSRYGCTDCIAHICRTALSLISLKLPHAPKLPTAATDNRLSTFTAQQTVEACVAALLFAAHPVHTEAVAGIVGHAELLSFALALLALLTYLSATTAALWTQHYKMLALSVGMLWSAALAKEIGITMVSFCHAASISSCLAEVLELAEQKASATVMLEALKHQTC